jgi:hypothetical protein
MNARRRRRPLRTAGILVLTVAALALLSGGIQFMWTRIDQHRFPWGYPELGGPALVGTWVGTLTMPGGVRRGVYMDLQLEPIDLFDGGRRYAIRSLTRSNFEGEVRLCGGERLQTFDILNGSARDNAASQFYVGLYPADSVPPDGLAPSHFRGRWDGHDSLTIEADVHIRRGQSAMSTGVDPSGLKPRLGMTRGDEAAFGSLCARMR